MLIQDYFEQNNTSYCEEPSFIYANKVNKQ